MSKASIKYIGIIAVVGLLLVGGYIVFGGSNKHEELDVTQAYETVQAKLTQAIEETNQAPPTEATEAPHWTATNTVAISITQTVAATTTPSPTSKTEQPVPCDIAAAGNPIDVTIPDDTEIQPGETFTKTWRLVNAGTCTWTKDYKIAFFSGDQMSGPATENLTMEVPPGATIDISVVLVAPLEAGTYQGNWKLKNAKDEWFGIGLGGGSAFWVRIIVPAVTITETPTPSPTGVIPTEPPTETPTTEIPQTTNPSDTPTTPAPTATPTATTQTPDTGS